MHARLQSARPTPCRAPARHTVRRGSLAALLVLAVVATAGCGSDSDSAQPFAVSCSIDSDCPAGQTCGQNSMCGMPTGNQLPDGGIIGDGGAGGDVSFGSPDTSVSWGDAAVSTSDTSPVSGQDAAGSADAGVPETSCVGRCGAVQGACACHSGCTAAGNCCDDYDSVCGGRTSNACKNDTECNDNLDCTLDICSGGVCSNKPGANVCLIDGKCVTAGTKGPGICLTCAPLAKNTGWTMDVGGACDDGEACTTNDACTASGTCAGTPGVGCCKNDTDCASTMPCQVGSCDTNTNKCTFTAKPGCCTKDTDCTGNAQPCKVLFCNATTNYCDVKSAAEGATCDDGDGCTISDACSSGFCLGKANTCDDKNPCTADSCQSGQCVHTPQTGCGACWDTTTQKPKPKGTACGTDVLGKEQRCGKGTIEERTAVAGCTGLNTTCSKVGSDQVWQGWQITQTCASGQTCVEKVPGQPACVTGSTGLPDLLLQSFKSTTTSYKAGNTAVVTGTLRNLGKGTAGNSTLQYRISTDANITAADLLLKSALKSSLTAGASSSITTSLLLPKTLKPGTWYLGVIADASGAVKESNELNNTALYKITITSTTVGTIDLYPYGVKSTKTSYTPGSTVFVSAVVKNQGTSPSGTFTAEWRLSTNSAITTVDPLLKVLNRPSLAGNGAAGTSTSFVLPANTKPGTYYIGIWVDRTNKVKESNEGNNTSTYKITVTAAAQADLLPLNFKTSTTSYKAGASVLVTASVKNAGKTSSGAFAVEWRLSTNSAISTGDKLLKTLSRPTLGGGATSNVFSSFSLPATTTPGTYYIGMWVDRPNAVKESNESNNVAVYKITVTNSTTALPDLIPVGFKMTSTTYLAGQTAVASASVKNQGKGPSGAFNVEWRLGALPSALKSDKLLKVLPRSALKAGLSTSSTTSFTLPATTTPGTYYIKMRVDSSAQIKETSETNNIAVYKITVTASSLPDLVPLSFKSSKTTYMPGNSVVVYGSVKNQGKSTAASHTLEWRLSSNPTITTTDKLLKTLSRPSLLAGSSVSALTTLTLPATTAPGTYYLGLVVDRSNVVKETSESNNIATYKITVNSSTMLPDLIPQSFKSSTSTLSAGGTVTVFGSVKNQGKNTAGGFTLEWRLSTNSTISTSDLLLKSLTRSSIAQGGTTSAFTSFVLPKATKPGTYYLGLWVDRTNKVKESAEGNNIATYKVVVTDSTKPDLIPQSFSVAKSSYGAGSVVTVLGSVKNQGKSTAGAFTMEWRLSTNSVLTTSDVLLKTLKRTSLAPGATTSAYTTMTLPVTTKPGTYYIGIWVDRTNQVSESSTTNNIAVYKITVTSPVVSKKADLQVTSIKPVTVALKIGSSTVLSSVIKNAGGTSGAFGTHFRLSTNSVISSGDTLLRIVERTSLATNASATLSALVTIPSHMKPGTYYLGVHVDGANAVAETSESNNIKTIKVTLTGNTVSKADLVPYMFKASVKTYKPGESVFVSAYVRNQGTLAAGAYKVELRISSNTTISISDQLWVTKPITSTKPGATSVVSGTFKLPNTLKAGKWYLGMRVDSGNSISESNEANNIATFPIIVSGSAQP